MPVAIDTSVLISSEKRGDFGGLLPENEEGPHYIPGLAAAEVGTEYFIPLFLFSLLIFLSDLDK
jgi:hypothetical protein